jgi:threonine/homoserine/homoserine lactone efflux protein
MAGLGAATADALYGCIAGFGLSALAQFLIAQQAALGLIGGLFLCYLGWQTFRSPIAKEAAGVEGRTLVKLYGSTLLLTLTNPATILSFVAIFAGLGLVQTTKNPAMAWVLVLGVFMGSALWWLMLSSGTRLLRDRLTPKRLTWVNRISGTTIFLFGLVALSSFGLK